MMRVPCVTTLVLLCARAGLSAQAPVSNSVEAAVADTVLSLAEAWVEAWNELNAERMLQLHSEDLQYYWRGRPMSYEVFQRALREDIIPNETYSIEMTDPHVQVLGPNAAVVAFQIRDKASPSGATSPATSALSLIFVRRDAEWKIVHIHESPVRDWDAPMTDPPGGRFTGGKVGARDRWERWVGLSVESRAVFRGESCKNQSNSQVII